MQKAGHPVMGVSNKLKDTATKLEFPVVEEEQRVLGRIRRHLAEPRPERHGMLIDYDAELINLRDQINEARMEDVPPLIEEMERLQQVAARRAQVTAGHVDADSPYFARMVLEENDQKREVLIGRSTYLDSRTGVRIVDWRNAPISRLYYRYTEGDDYEEDFGGRRVEGEVLVRRSLGIRKGELQRVTTPEETYVQTDDGGWRKMAVEQIQLQGGQGTALRPEHHHKPGQLGIGVDGQGRTDRYLPEITSLIDATQFELITRPDAGLVVIQGGAGSGKTTIGLHRMAYLAYQDPKRFRPDKMLIVVFNQALARYMSKVLPALGVEGVAVVTYEAWAEKVRRAHFPLLPHAYSEETPGIVTKLKKHPVMLRLIEEHIDRAATLFSKEAREGLSSAGGSALSSQWKESQAQPLLERLELLRRWSKKDSGLSRGDALQLQSVIDRWHSRRLDPVEAWAEVLGDEAQLKSALDAVDKDSFSAGELQSAHTWCLRHCDLALQEIERRQQDSGAEGESDSGEQDMVGVDGQSEKDVITLDREDDTLLLRIHQMLRGPLRQRKERMSYEHILVDEAQDLSPVELAVILGTASESQSVTFAGDVAQRLLMDNGFSTWEKVFGQLGLSHTNIEPLRISYRSTVEIIEFAQHVLGDVEQGPPGRAVRSGAPVELFRFTHTGDAVGFLGEALREVVRREPLSSIALIARHPEQADMYYEGLISSEVPNVRRVANQDFPFKPGVDVTDIRQVKGLEFDYVVLLETSAAVYPNDDESRHLLHIGATRAAHQLWIVAVGQPSRLLPMGLLDAAL
ncbi:MAG: UvrD-helicase domain-containing protein [Myxococcales bacterium]|nr:UvrD-helicase domain-containing protein [Myxococcales bacterium]MCB9707974.1 UvrD-helicase domain-containing protein [Myxococcales bacterium]